MSLHPKYRRQVIYGKIKGYWIFCVNYVKEKGVEIIGREVKDHIYMLVSISPKLEYPHLLIFKR